MKITTKALLFALFWIPSLVLVAAPEIAVEYNGTNIPDNDSTPSLVKGTDFGNLPTTGFEGMIIRSFEIKNTGSSTMVISGIDVIDDEELIYSPHFAAIDVDKNSVPPGGTSIMRVGTYITDEGPVKGWVRIFSNATNISFAFAVSAVGISLNDLPEISVEYDGVNIADGDATPSTAEGTDFGSWDIYSGFKTRTFRVRNTGGSTLTLGTPISNDSEFIVEGLATSVRAGSWDYFSISFKPNSRGTKQANISFTTNDDDENPFNFAVRGVATDRTWIPPEVSVEFGEVNITDGDVTPSTVDGTDFGSWDIDSNRRTRTFRVRNSGGSTLMLGTPISNDSEFIVEGLATSIGAGGSDLFSISFDPTSRGTKQANISFTTNDDDENPFNFAVRGVGTETSTTPPEISVDFDGVNIVDGDATPSTSDGTDFGSWDIDSNRRTRTFRVRNSGGSTLMLGTPISNDSEFIVEGLATSIGAGGSDLFSISFDPTSRGTKQANISFTTNDGDENPFNFAVRGVGTETSTIPPEISVEFIWGVNIVDGDATPSTSDGTDFGIWGIDSNRITRTFIVRNSGGSTLTLGTPSSNDSEFIVWGLASSIPAGSYDFFTISFDPNSRGTKQANISFTTNDGDENPFNFAVRGVGTETSTTPPEISVDFDGVNIVDGDATPSTADGTDFGSWDIGSNRRTRIFRVRNTGGSTLLLRTPHSNDSEFIVEGLATSIPAGGSDLFTISFNPTSRGTKQANISFTTNASNGYYFNFAVRGVGTETSTTPPEISVGFDGVNIVDGDATPSTSDGTDFGSQNVSSGAVIRAFQVRNTGGSTLTLGTASSNDSEFVVNGLVSSISAGGWGVFTITFNPDSAGSKQANISFSTNDSDENPFNFAVRGVGFLTVNPGPLAGRDTTLSTRRPEFTWPSVSGASWYQIWVNRNGSTYHGEWVNGSTSWTAPEEWKGGSYEWWVRGWGPSIGFGSWSSEATFRIPVRTPGTLTLLSPQGEQGGTSLTYRWEKDADATWYRIWVGGEDAGTWHDRWFNLTGEGQGSAYLGTSRPANAKPAPTGPTGTVGRTATFEWSGGKHTWWLRAWGPDGYGPWSGPMTFTVPYPSGTWVRLFVRRGNTTVLDQWTQSGSYSKYLSVGSHSWWMGVYDPASGQTRWSGRVDFQIE